MARELPPERAALVRACAEDPVVRALLPSQLDWDVPHRILTVLELALWPGDERRLVGEMSSSGDWLEWWG